MIQNEPRDFRDDKSSVNMNDVFIYHSDRFDSKNEIGKEEIRGGERN